MNSISVNYALIWEIDFANHYQVTKDGKVFNTKTGKQLKRVVNNQNNIIMKLIISQDQFAESPRDWENLGTMVCKHSSYDLGDEQMPDPIDWLSGMLDLEEDQIDRIAKKLRCGYYSDRMLEELKFRFGKKFIYLDLYLYDHSGITIQTTPFGCHWDSGQVGIIYVSIEAVKKEYGWKSLSQNRHGRILTYLDNEVKTYDQFLRGDVYMFDFIDEFEGESACGGFYGTDWENNGIKDCLPKVAWPLLEDVEIEYN
jgi:hypothetical protein